MGRQLAQAFVLLLALCAGFNAHGKEAAPLAANPALEAEVMAVAEELRCLVCQNETIAASHSALAVDLRKQIAQQLAEGRSRQQIRDYMTDRYGEFVLYRPLFNATNALLWLGPFVLLLGGVFALWRSLRGRAQGAAAQDMSDADLQHVRSVLEGKTR